jgi:hypothetical protein
MNDQASMPIAPGASKPRRWGRWLTGAGIIGVVAAACFFAPELLRVVGFKPLVFNESWYSHKHCIKQWGVAVQVYANDHAGAFPAHPLGYAAALQLLMRPPDYNMGTYLVMGAPGGYTGKVFEVANANGTWVREADCGRVYVQGLREDSNPQIALLFDKQPSPGDHAHGWRRWNAPLRREVRLVGVRPQANRTPRRGRHPARACRGALHREAQIHARPHRRATHRQAVNLSPSLTQMGPRNWPSPFAQRGEKVAAGRMRGAATCAVAANPSPRPAPQREREPKRARPSARLLPISHLLSPIPS